MYTHTHILFFIVLLYICYLYIRLLHYYLDTQKKHMYKRMVLYGYNYNSMTNNEDENEKYFQRATVESEEEDEDEDEAEEEDDEVSEAPPVSSSKLPPSTELKSRLRWTPPLHARFVDAVDQLGGPQKATPKSLLRIMDVKGITLYHLKSHLQKYRLGKYSIKEWSQVPKKGSSGSLESTTSLGFLPSHQADGYELIGEGLGLQKEIQAKLHLQSEAERRLLMRQEAEHRYLDTAFQTACKMLAEQYVTSATAGNGGIFEQDVTSLGTTVSISPFYQQELYPAYHCSRMPIDVPFGLQDHVGSLCPQRETHSIAGDSQTSYGHFTSLSLETFPLIAEGRKKRVQSLDEDPAETYLILDNNETGKQSGI